MIHTYCILGAGKDAYSQRNVNAVLGKRQAKQRAVEKAVKTAVTLAKGCADTPGGKLLLDSIEGNPKNAKDIAHFLCSLNRVTNTPLSRCALKVREREHMIA